MSMPLLHKIKHGKVKNNNRNRDAFTTIGNLADALKDDVFTTFDDLTDDLKIEILSRLPARVLSTFTRVSKSWQRLIINFCYPNMAAKLAYSGLVYSEHVSWFGECVFFEDSLINEKFDTWWGSLIMSSLSKRELLDICNGLFLFSTKNIKGSNISQPTSILCDYVVLNPFTKQFNIMAKPNNPRTRDNFHDNFYAALAYEPSKSCHYKIVHFQDFNVLNIFNSKSRDWITLTYQLEDHVVKAHWEKRIVYFEGALYRLSSSGHLIRFLVDQASFQVQAIELPKFGTPKEFTNRPDIGQRVLLPEQPKEDLTSMLQERIGVSRVSRGERVFYLEEPFISLGCVGVNKGQIHFSHSDESRLCIWQLRCDCSGINNNYEWLLKSTISFKMTPSIYCQPVAFHPYDDTIFLSERNTIMIVKYHFGDTEINEPRFSQTSVPNTYRFVFLFLRCEVPFV